MYRVRRSPIANTSVELRQRALTRAGYDGGMPDEKDGSRTYTAVFAAAAVRQSPYDNPDAWSCCRQLIAEDAIAQTGA